MPEPKRVGSGRSGLGKNRAVSLVLAIEKFYPPHTEIKLTAAKEVIKKNQDSFLATMWLHLPFQQL